jgi:hypothetical protein
LIIINIESYTIFLCLKNDKFVMKFIVQFCLDFSKIKSDYNKSCDLCFTNLTRWHVKQMSTYFLTFLFMLFQKYFLFNKSKIFSCSKWSTYESSWFCFKNFLLRSFEKMYHLFFQRNKSFSMFHLNDDSRSTFSRLLFDTTSSFFFESRRFAFSFFLSCFIDAFSTKNRTRCANESNCCRINNTMRSFKNKTLNVVFLLETFFIQFLEAKSSLFATFSSRNFFEIFSISRNDDLKDFFFFQNFFHNRNDFFFLQEVLCVFNDWDLCAYLEIIVCEIITFRFFVDYFQNLWRIVICIRQNELSMIYQLKEICIFFFSFLLVRVFLFSIKTHFLKFKFSLFIFSFVISFS